MLVLELARCGYILGRENVIALGNSGTGKTHIALALGLAACQKGFPVTFITAASLVNLAPGGARRAPPAQASARTGRGQAPDRRRTRLRAVVVDGGRAAV